MARGAYLVRAAGCVTCHTDAANGGAPLAGGRTLHSPYGTFAVPNITPDRETGIGGWSDEDFVRAVTRGRSPDGTTYYPAFPYPAYSGLTRRDVLDMKAYLFSLPPIERDHRDHALRFPFSWRFSIYPWRWLFFDPTPEPDDRLGDPVLARGRYLVEVLGHCAECHTPRNLLGSLKRARHLAGTRYGPKGALVPNITPDVETGIGAWSDADLVFFLRTGIKPDGDDVQGEMREAISDGLSRLTDSDLAAMAAYLKSVPAIENVVAPRRNRPDTGSAYDDW